MMKKLMVLSLVLAIGAVSNAALVVVEDSGLVSIGVDVAVKGYELVVTVIDGDVTLDGSAVDFGFNWDFNNNIAFDTPVLFRASGSQFFGADQGPGTLVSGLAVQGMGSIQVVDLYNSSFEPVIMRVIPEPMTMGLLGLGALFLRRRK